MTEQDRNTASNEKEGAHQRQKEQYVFKPKRGASKPGKDRRLKIRSNEFDKNLYRKMDGQEIPKTLRVSTCTCTCTHPHLASSLFVIAVIVILRKKAIILDRANISVFSNCLLV